MTFRHDRIRLARERDRMLLTSYVLTSGRANSPPQPTIAAARLFVPTDHTSLKLSSPSSPGWKGLLSRPSPLGLSVHSPLGASPHHPRVVSVGLCFLYRLSRHCHHPPSCAHLIHFFRRSLAVFTEGPLFVNPRANMQDGTGDTEPVSFHESAQPYATQISHAVPHHHPYDPQSHLVYPHPYRQHQIPTGPPCLSRPALPVQERHSPRRQPTVDLARELPPDFPTLFGPVPVTVHTPVQFNQPLDDIEDARPTPTQSYTAIPPYPPPPLSPSYLSDRLRSLPFSRPPPHHSTTNVEVTSLSSPHPRIYASTNQHPPHRPLPSPLLHAPFHPPSRNIHPIPITEPLAPTSMNNQTHVQPPMFPYPPTYESFSMDRSIDMDAEALQHERQYEAELQRWRSSEQTWRHDRGILTAEDVDGDLMGTGPSTASRMISEQTFEDDLLPPEGIPMQAPRANHMRLQSSTEPLRSFDGGTSGHLPFFLFSTLLR